MAKAQRSGPVPSEARPAPQGASRTGETVTVACKLPNGIILRGFRRDVRQVNVLGGGTRDEPFYSETGQRVHIYGNARPKGGSFRTRVVAGYALTQNVPKDLWDEWVAANRETPMVANRLVFAVATVEGAADLAREGRAIRSGLEPMKAKIEEDPRTPRPVNPDVGNIQMETDKMKPEHFEAPADEEMA